MCKLLVIDDSHVEHIILQNLFEHYKLFEDYKHSEDGKASLDILKKNRTKGSHLPDLILLDLYMPNFSGWDFVAQFNKVYSTFKKKIDIVITSTSIDPADISKSKLYPFIKGYFMKPLSIETLEELSHKYSAKRMDN